MVLSWMLVLSISAAKGVFYFLIAIFKLALGDTTISGQPHHHSLSVTPGPQLYGLVGAMCPIVIG